MNQAEREVLARIHTLTVALPGTVAHGIPTTRARDRLRLAAREVGGAISALGFGDLDEADSYIYGAEQILGIDVTPRAHDEPTTRQERER